MTNTSDAADQLSTISSSSSSFNDVDVGITVDLLDTFTDDALDNPDVS